MKKIVVFGSINIDLSINVSYMPEQGETIKGSGFMISPGGKGANQAVAASRLGGDVHLIGSLGDDDFGHRMLLSLKKENVKTTFVEITENIPSATAIIIRNDGDNRIILNTAANDCLTVRSLEKFIAAHDDIDGSIFVTQLEANTENTLKALKNAKQHQMITIFNPSPAIQLPFDVYPDVDVLVINQNESRILSGIYPNSSQEGRKVYQKLSAAGLKKLIITIGKKGSYIYEGDKTDILEGYKVNSVDSTGAGDSYIGALSYGLSKGWTLIKSAELANAVSAYACTAVGAQAGMPTLEQVTEFMGEKGGEYYE